MGESVNQSVSDRGVFRTAPDFAWACYESNSIETIDINDNPIFTESATLGRFSHKVAISICVRDQMQFF